MWISARTALTLAAAALLLVVVAVGAPLMPRPHLPPLPGRRPTHVAAEKFGTATPVLDAPERVRSQRMETAANALPGAAQWMGRVGAGTALVPTPETVARLRTLLKDARTVADPRAERAEPAWVVRFVRNEHRVDVMADPAQDRLVVVEDGQPVGGFAIAGLHREFAELDAQLRKVGP